MQDNTNRPPFPLRLHREDYPFSNCLNIVRDNYAEDAELWAEVCSVLIDLEYSHKATALSVEQRIEITRLCLTFDPAAVARHFGLNPKSMTKQVSQVLAAVCFITNNDVVFPMEALNKEGLEQVEIFRKHAKKKTAVQEAISSPRVLKVIKKFPLLAFLLGELAEHGSIRPYLNNVGLVYVNEATLDAGFYKFACSGQIVTGLVSLLRKLLYLNWLDAGDLGINSKSVNLNTQLRDIGIWAFTASPIHDTFKNTVKLFFKYIVIKDLIRYLNSTSMDSFSVSDVFPLCPLDDSQINSLTIVLQLSSINPNAARMLSKGGFFIRNGFVYLNIDWLSYFADPEPKQMMTRISEYVKTFTESSSRESVGSEIAQTLSLSKGSGIQIYKLSINLIDLLLMTGRICKDSEISGLLQKRWINNIVSQYREAITKEI